MKRAPVRLKTYQTWCVVNSDGMPKYPPERADTPKYLVESCLDVGCRIARVEIREVQKRWRKT